MLAAQANLLAVLVTLFPLPVGGLAAQGGNDSERAVETRTEEDLDGPPLVNARAWAVADAASGELLWAHAAARQMPIASTTKIMTACLVLELATEEPAVLREEVSVSRFAASTGGSSAGLRTGEKVEVGELLYALLLPSGNDAANALAEHFGPRFDPPASPGEPRWSEHRAGSGPGWVRFVAEMNRRAAALELDRTHYQNPHGLDAEGHVSCAADLVVLAREAMLLPAFRKVVATAEYKTTIVGPGGTRRQALWRNTNKLLAIRGYTGIKTGTTAGAGCCLVAGACRGERELIIVVLDSVGRDGRYVDARNLLRWAFRRQPPVGEGGR